MTEKKSKNKNMEKVMKLDYVIKPKEHTELLYSVFLYTSLASHALLDKTLDHENRPAPLKFQSFTE